jgi:hypothetical protein
MLRQPPARAVLRLYASEPRPVPSTPACAKRCSLAVRALRCVAMSAALVLIIVVALLCAALLALLGLLWVALHFGVGEDD